MYDNGIRQFDDITTYSFLISLNKADDTILTKYNKFGGYEIISELVAECGNDKENHEYHCSEMQKYEMLRYFQDEGLIDINKEITIKGKKVKMIDNLIRMNLQQLKMYFQLKHKQASMNINSGQIKVYNLMDSLNETIDDLDKGEGMGLDFNNSHRLNKITKGIKLGNLMYLVLPSGVGKSSIMMEKAVMSLITKNEKAIIFANEEGIKRFRALMLATVASTILKKPISRERLLEGSFTDEEKEKLKLAANWLREHKEDLIKLIELEKYRMEDVINNIDLYRPLGYKYAIIDTFKPDQSNGEKARWEKFSDQAQDLDNCIKESANNVGCLATVQLKIGKEYRYLDLDVIGKSLEIVEVAGTVMAGRLMFSDEYPGEKNELKVYNWKKNEFNNKWEKDFDVFIDCNKQYLILFIPKNRFGGTEQQIVFEINYKYNSWNEIGYCQVPRNARNIQ